MTELVNASQTHNAPRRGRRALVAGAVATTMAAGFVLANNAEAATIHYHGVTAGAQSTVVVNAGNQYLERVTHPEGSVDADIDPIANTISNVVVVVKPIDTPILPSPLNGVPLTAHIESSIVGTPVSTMAPNGLSGVYNVTSQATTRLAVTILAGSVKLTDPTTCFVDVALNLAGTANTSTMALDVAQTGFTIPSFPATGCGLFGPILTAAVSGNKNNADLHYTKA
jgi:hypothetical protein